MTTKGPPIRYYDSPQKIIKKEWIEGELLSLVIFSERQHVDYIYPILDSIEETVERKGHKVYRLGDRIRSGESYLQKLDELIDGCVLGIVILDGLRPNVLFEFGYLLGKNKPVIILKSNAAFVSIKTLYPDIKESGLTKSQFDKLINPSLNLSKHLSDYAGWHFSEFDHYASKHNENHISQILSYELDKFRDKLSEEMIKVKTKGIDSNLGIMTLINNVLKHFNAITIHKDQSLHPIEQLKTAFHELNGISLEQKSTQIIDTYHLIAASFLSKFEDLQNKTEGIEYAKLAIEVYETMLKRIPIEDNPTEYGITNRRIGDVYFKLGKSEDKEYLKYAIAAYRKALQVYACDINNWSEEYAEIENSLGDSYLQLAKEGETVNENCKLAISAYNKALQVYRVKKWPEEYTLTQNNLGVAYYTLKDYNNAINAIKRADMKNPDTLYNMGLAYFDDENYVKAADCFTQALDIDTNNKKIYLHKRALAYRYVGHYDDAVSDYDTLLNLYSDSLDSEIVDAYSSRGQTLAETGKFSDALEDLDKAISLAIIIKHSALEAYGRNGRGLALGGMDRYEEALLEFEHSIKLCPENAWVYYNRALIFERMGQIDKAIQDFKVALKKNDPPLNTIKRKTAKSKLAFLTESANKKYYDMLKVNTSLVA